MQTSLVIKKESKFDKVKKRLLMFFLKEQYFMMQELDLLTKPKRPQRQNIIIPKEMSKNKRKKLYYEKYQRL